MDYITNIKGCLFTYADTHGAMTWLRRAHGECSQAEFNDLLVSLRDLIGNELGEQHSQNVYNALSRLDFDQSSEIFTEIEPDLKDKIKFKERSKATKNATREKRHTRTLRIEEEKRRNQEQQAQLRAERHRAAREEQRRQREIEARRQQEREERDRQERLVHESRRTQALVELEEIFEKNFIQSDDYFYKHCGNLVTHEEFTEKKAAFVRSWFKRNGEAELDEEQLSAIYEVNYDLQVLARAGSGKTKTLVHRSFFLQKHCGVAPEEILILTFNKKAAEEISQRLQNMLNLKNKHHNTPYIMTFHSLAYAIVHPEEKILFDDSDSSNHGLARVFQQIIDEHRKNPKVEKEIREVMVAHFREDWERIVCGGYNLNQQEMLLFRRSLPKESLKGDPVKSFGEKVIANFLFEHDIDYIYEKNHWWKNINYRPDFTIRKTENSGIIIEYFGLKGNIDYDSMSNSKRKYWESRPNWTFIEFTPTDIVGTSPEIFEDTIKNALDRHDISYRRLSDCEIWKRLKDRAIDRFTRAIAGFVGRSRKRWLSPDKLSEFLKTYTPISHIEGKFIRLALDFYKAYLERVEATGEDDFDGLMQRAAEHIDENATEFARRSEKGNLKNVRFTFVDEFQDFSELFWRILANSIRKNPNMRFFCVGDNWQAINGFAGSDLEFFNNFEQYFDKPQKLSITTNYRSSQKIVEVGNALMHGLGKTAAASRKNSGQVLLGDLSKFETTRAEQKRHPGDMITPAVVRLVREALRNDGTVALLARKNSLPWLCRDTERPSQGMPRLEDFLWSVRSYFQKPLRDRIDISTAHRYKGLEKHTVIVLDAVARCYPLIHTDWVFSRILGDSLESIIDEERRLFYVALTRAIDKLILITEAGKESPFLIDLGKRINLEKIDWNRCSPVETRSGVVVVKVGNQPDRGSNPTYNIRSSLAKAGFEWEAAIWKGWRKIYPAENFDEGDLREEPWSREANGIEVRISFDQEDQFQAYFVDQGAWRRVR